MLAETFKYLYLLFASPEDILLDLDQFVFTTEAHLLPLSLARINRTHFNMVGVAAFVHCLSRLSTPPG